MNKISKTDYTIDIDSVMTIIDSIDVEWNDQLCITSRSGNNLFDGIGSINNYSGYTEKDFNVLNKEFKNTCIEQLLNDLEKDGYTTGRVRIMRMNPKTVYSYHMDCEPRLHFALKTNPGAMFIIDDEVFRVPADGYGYHMNTTLPHTAVNASLEIRIHIVIDLLIPVTKVVSDNLTTYKLLNKTLSHDEFNNWLTETKPLTEPVRMDYYFTN